MNQQSNRNQVVALSADQFKQEIVLARPTIEKMLPKHLEFEKFEGMVVNVVANNRKLLECSQTSLLRAVIDSADVGLSLNPVMREADILPVWSPNGTVAQFRPRAIGYMKLARQSGEIVSISAHEVYEKDFFDYEYGLEDKLVHKPLKDGDRGKITHGYCVWKLKDGTKSFEVIDRVRIDRSRNASEGWKYAVKEGKTNSVWHLHEGEMVRKTAIRAASKYFPMSNESEAFMRAMAAEGAIDGVFEEVQDDLGTGADDQPSQAAGSQVQSLEHKLGVGGAQQAPAAPAEAVQQPPAAPAATPPANPRRTRAAAAPKPAEAQQGPVGPEPPPHTEDDFPAMPDSLRAENRGRTAPRNDTMPEVHGDDPNATAPKPVDWAVEARTMRNKIVACGDDASLWKKFLADSLATRQRMALEAPSWYAKISAEIASKESWFSS